MKFFYTLCLLCGISVASYAQTGNSTTKFSFGFEAGLPVGDANTVYNAVLGGSMKAELPVGPASFFTLSVGYNAFMVKSMYKDMGAQSSVGFVPLKAGIKHYFDSGFFGEAQAGVIFSTESGGGSAFAYAPGVGYTFADGFEMGFRYEGWPKNGVTISQLGLRLAYRF